MDEFNFRLSINIGATIPFKVVSNSGYHLHSGEEHIDVVLSLHFPSYWPTCADRWRKNKRFLDKLCFKKILHHGVSFVCKVPDPTLFDRRNLFRSSFSFAESIIKDHVSTEQKEAYRLLKIVREIELKDYIFLGTLLIKDELAKSLTSYHLKSIFQNLSIKTVVSEALEDGGCYIWNSWSFAYKSSPSDTILSIIWSCSVLWIWISALISN